MRTFTWSRMIILKSMDGMFPIRDAKATLLFFHGKLPGMFLIVLEVNFHIS